VLEERANSTQRRAEDIEGDDEETESGVESETKFFARTQGSQERDNADGTERLPASRLFPSRSLKPGVYR
jgi:hypothetical protein